MFNNFLKIYGTLFLMSLCLFGMSQTRVTKYKEDRLNTAMLSNGLREIFRYDYDGDKKMVLMHTLYDLNGYILYKDSIIYDSLRKKAGTRIWNYLYNRVYTE